MKSFALVAAVCAAASLSASAEKCVLTKLVKELEPITKMVYACYDATGYAVIPPRTNPTAEQTVAVCTKCADMITTAKTMTFATCTFAVSGVDIPLNEWMPKIIGACDTSTGAAGTGATSNATSSSNSTASAPTTAGNKANSTASTSGTTTVNNSSAVTTPTPAPTTGSANAVASLSVAAVAVGSIAASLLL